MDLLTQIITVLFIALIFYGVITGLVSIPGISVWGLFKGLHNKNTLTISTSIIVLIVIFVGVNSIAPRIRNESVQVEVDKASKETYIHEVVFPDDNVAIERIPKESIRGVTNDAYYVITESDNMVYVVTLYPEEAFGLMRYEVEYFNHDERLE